MKSRKLFAALLCALLCLLAAGIALAEGEPYPESAHPYANNTDQSWTYTWPDSNAEYLKLTFSVDSYTESNYDYVYILDSQGTQQYILTGSLAEKPIYVKGSSFTVMLTSNSRNIYYGFAFSDISVATYEETHSGTCGANIIWKLSLDGTLTISGTGPMSDYSDDLFAPWYFCQNSIKSVVIESGVTSIGEGAFSNCDSLTRVVIPSSVISIGEGAFGGCTSLKSITIPDGVTSICGGAFGECSHLTNVIIPNSVTIIGENAFCDCTSLKNIFIPYSVETISGSDLAWSPFDGCIDLTIWTDAQEKQPKWDAYWNGDQNVVYGIMREDIEFWNNCNNAVENFIIPNGVTSIPSNAFYGCENLTSITIPSSVTSIGNNAFYGCNNIKNLYLENLETYINISFGKEESYPHKHAQNIFIDNVLATEEQIGRLTVATGYCGNHLKWSLSVAGTLTISGTGTMDNYRIISYTSIPWYSYSNAVKNIVIVNGVNNIGSYAFRGCNSLTSITIPDSVTSIGDSAFQACTSLTSITIPDSVTSIGQNAFLNCSSLKNVFIPSSVQTISASSSSHSPFCCCDSLTIWTDAREKQSGWGDYWNYSRTVMYGTTRAECTFWSNCDKSAEHVIIPEGVTSIPEKAFYNCSSLTSITIPDGVTSIGDSAFYGCSGLTSITIPDSVTSIGEWAFFNCSGLTSINIPYGATSIGNYAFSGCSSLINIDIPDSVMSIGDDAFSGCSSLTSINIPDSVSSIGNYAFENCSSLTSIRIPDGVTSIGSYTFFGDGNLNLYLSDNISSIGFYALYNVSRIFCKPHTITSAYVGRYYIPGNNDFCLTENDGRVKVYSYYGGLNNVTIPDGINEWIYSSTISAVRLPSTLCETDVFTLKAAAVTVPEGVSAMGTLSLSGVQKIFIPASVTDMSGVNVTDGSVPTVYCTMDSEAELWAIVNGYDIIYTDRTGWDDTCVLTYVGKEIRLDVGEEYTLSASDFSIQPLPAGDLSVTLTGNGNVSVSGMTLKANVSGSSGIIAAVSGSTVTVPVHVYEGATDFVLTSQKFAGAGESFTVTLSDALPADISGKFTWRQDGGTPMTDTVLTHTFTAPSQPGSTVITVTAPGGYTKSVTVTVAGSISAPYAGGNSRAAVTGSFIDICVDVDGVTYRNTAELYGEVTVPATAAGIIELTEDGRVHVIGSGRTAFSVTGLDGKKVNFIVVASEPGDILTLPADTLSIGEEAFAGTAAQKAVLPSGCVSIGSRAFAGSAVQIVNVPASVTSIADDAFSGCSVTVYCPAGSYAESWCAENGVNCVSE